MLKNYRLKHTSNDDIGRRKQALCFGGWPLKHVSARSTAGLRLEGIIDTISTWAVLLS